MIASTSSPVPTGTVDLVTTKVKPWEAGDLFGRMHIGQVGATVAVPQRRAHRHEHGVRFPGRVGIVLREEHPFLAHIAGDQILQPRLLVAAASIRSARDALRVSRGSGGLSR